MPESGSVTYMRNGKEFTRRERRVHTDEFKLQVVQLYEKGKPKSALCREYDLNESVLTRWIKQYQNSGTFGEANNRSPEDNELLNLQKENRRLRMENDILKQAALILGRQGKN